jgi:hypothetical protein
MDESLNGLNKKSEMRLRNVTTYGIVKEAS